MTNTPRPAGDFLLRELLPVILVALAVFFAVRRFALEQYLVPSGSMAPTLVGDPRYGDRVLVDKVARWWWQPERFDMVVLRNPEDRDAYLVKRLVALPGETVRIRAGDVWLEDELGATQRLQKDPIADRDLQIPWLQVPDPDAPQPFQPLHSRMRGDPVVRIDAGTMRLLPGAATAAELAAGFDPEPRRARLEALEPDGTVPGFLSTSREVDTGFPMPGGRRGGDTQELARDPGMTVRVVPEIGLTAILMAWEHRGAVHLWVYGVDGGLRYLAPDGAQQSWRGPPLEPGRPVELRFGHLDGRRYLAVDGEVVDLADVVLPESPYAYEYPRPRPPRNGLHLGCAGRGGPGMGGVRIEALAIHRDLQYRNPDIPGRNRRRIVVPEDEFFLLGDNAMESRDSASVDRPRFRVADLVGRPVMVLAPNSRRRTLVR